MTTQVQMLVRRPNGSGGYYEKGTTYPLADDLANYLLGIGAARRTALISETLRTAAALNPDGKKFDVQDPDFTLGSGGADVSGNPINFSVTGSVVATPVTLLKIKCNTGSGLVLTLYDNASAASGTTLFTSAAMTAGVEFVIKQGDVPGLPVINGVYASVTGTGTFTLEVE